MGWGSNAFGQLNQPVGVGQLRDITLGLRHTSALRTDGTVVCWGHDGFNQVGSLPAGLSSVVAIHAGDNHTIALRADGTVVCWGDNIFEQCDVPVGLAPAVGVSAGEATSGVLHADGTVTLWGWDSSDGRLNVPTDLGSVTKLELGMTFGTVLRADGTVRYWGAFAPPIDASAVLRDIAAFTHVLGLRPDGTVQAWGANGSGQATVPAGLADVAAVAAGRIHSLALKQDGSVVCWGSNARGQAPNPAPITANGQQVAAGEEFSYGLTLAGGIAAPSIVVVSSTDPVCGLNNGAIDTTVANADFVFWTGPSGFFRNGADLTGLAAGAYTVTAVGHGGSVSQVVTLTAQSDTTAPVVTSYDAAESTAAGLDCTALVPDFTASVVAEDNCTAAAALVITQLPAAGTALGLGAHDITITVADGSDNEATVTAVFTVTGTAVSYYVDADSDAFGAGEAVVYCNTATPPGYATNNGDCDDTQLLYADNDGDIFGAGAPVACGVPTNWDCNDADSTIYPGAVENCANDGTDNDCDGEANSDAEATDAFVNYVDADHDGFGAGAATMSCSAIAGSVTNASDCNDSAVIYADADGDGYGAGAMVACGGVASNTDCDDADSTTYPGALEVCGNILVDNDCDGDMSAEEAIDSVSYYVDGDADGFGAGAATKSCAPIEGSVTNSTDCDDASNSTYPGAPELCSNLGTDNDCDLVNTEEEASDRSTFYRDADGDGFTGSETALFCIAPPGYEPASEGDCNDADASTYPGAPELCSNLGTDNDCDGVNTEEEASDRSTFYRDADDDTFTGSESALFCTAPAGYEPTNEGDCNDANNAVYPGAVENCANDGTDNDCDGIATDDAEAIDSVSYYVDADSDTFGSITATAVKSCSPIAGSVTNNTDCDDTRLLYADNDGDTYGAGARVACGVPTNTDCNDGDATTYPDAPETCANDGIDNDCDGEANSDAEAVDSVGYFVDGDRDGFGAGAETKSCTPIDGSVTNNTDCNDAQKFFEDNDQDGFGSTICVPCGGSTNNADCNDTSNAVYPGAVENCANDGTDNDCDGEANSDAEAIDSVSYYLDADEDGFGAGAETKSCTAIAGSVTNNTDCDDTKLLYADNDADTFGAGAPVACGVITNTDCNDADSSTFPGAIENCANDGTDNDCDGEANSDAEAVDSVSYYVDADEDSFGAGAETKSCTPIAGSVTNNADCDDKTLLYADNDGDTYGAGAPVACGVTTNTDCNDASNAVNPGAIENCANLAVDNDCDGSTAEDEAIDRTTFYPDLDGDGAGDPAGPTVVACDAPAGHVLNADDGCPSDAAKVAPGACGCGQPDTDSNSDGIADCNSLIVRLTPERVSVQPGTQFTLRVSSVTTLRSVAYQLGMHFDPSRLTLTAVTPAPGTPFDLQLAATIDNAAGTVVYMAGVSSLDGFFAGGASLFELHFTASAATGCDLAGAITFGNVGSIESSFVLEGVIRLDPITEGLAAFSIDGTPPMITGAGMTSGALADCTAPVPDFRHLPVDGCSTANELVITQNPAPGTAAGLGVTDVTVVATDAAGNTNFAVLPFTVTGDPVVYYMDADGDGFGAGSPTTACAPIFGSVDNGADCNDTNPSVYPGSPELCGDALDNDCDGQLNEGCTVFTLRLASDAPSVSAGGTFTVRASCTAPAAALSGAQITLHFDATRLRLEAVDPVGGNPLDFELVEQIDNSAGTLRYALGCLSTDCGLTQAADLCDLTFTVLPSASLCGATELVAFGPVGAFTTRFTRLADAAPIVPALTNLPSINLDSVPPILSGVPADISVPTDAGSTFGALVSLPTVTATDNCDGPVAVTATGIPSGGIFAIGATTVTWTATDAAGNTATSSRTVTVGDYQLLDAVVSFSNPQLGASRHALRIGAGAAVEVVDTLIPAWSGTPPTTPTSATVTVHVPVASSYPCVSAKSVGATVSGGAVRASHTLTDTAAASVSGSRYLAEFVLLSGDSNDDDMVEILDYGNWLVDRSMPGDSARAPEARSNYNGDGLVIQGDVGLVVAYFFRVGESCTQGADAPRTPRDRIHVKELRRMGRGDLAAADLNHDGWVDTRDMQMALQGGGGAQPRPEHDLRVEW